jgi:hypothetical protein
MIKIDSLYQIVHIYRIIIKFRHFSFQLFWHLERLEAEPKFLECLFRQQKSPHHYELDLIGGPNWN